MLGPSEPTPDLIRSAVRTVLADASYRANAGRVRDEIAAIPDLDAAIEMLERLARDKAPIVAAS
jgi:UDP:flavonoid glycosyltransferase YjiC (YdhE family)